MRFASVYRDFKDVKEFLSELMPLLRARDDAESNEKPSGEEPLTTCAEDHSR